MSGIEQAQSDLRAFCRLVRARSTEIQEAMRAVSQLGLRSVTMGLLRQELDSMVRVIYLLHQDAEERARLLRLSALGDPWTARTSRGRERRVSDRDMVDLAQELHGWAQNVYRFGCACIHLSSMHDYGANDPFASLQETDRRWVVDFLRQYHGASVETVSSFEQISDYAPAVLNKISTNLEFELAKLEGASTTATP